MSRDTIGGWFRWLPSLIHSHLTWHPFELASLSPQQIHCPLLGPADPSSRSGIMNGSGW